MPPKLALLLGFVFMAWLFHSDMRWRSLPSRALWIPGLLLAFVSSQPPAYWLYVMGLAASPDKLEGSPINKVILLCLYLIGILVLRRRNFSWINFFLSNKALIAILAYFLCSTLWSPFPNSTLRQCIHNIGMVIVGLVIMTDNDPVASLKVVFARVSFVLFPLSVIFIKYFPHIGRFVSSVSGVHMLSGVAGHKNSLGSLAMVFCLILLWDLMGSKSHGAGLRKKHSRLTRIISLSIGLYLLIICESATALMCFIIGVVMLFTSKRLARMKNPRKVLMLGALGLLFILGIEEVFKVSEIVLTAIGRDITFTGRTEIWRVTLEKNTNYLIGHGLGAFWHTIQGESVWREIVMNPLSSAHSGFLETYLDGGTIALFLLAAFIWATGINALEKLVNGDPIGQLALIFWLLLLLNNVTESMFFIPEPLWFTMLLVTNDIPKNSKDVQEVHG